MTKLLARTDTKIARLIKQELARQRDGLVLIASENYASPAVLEALGSPLNNKYAEGYPGKRYYAGCEVVDEVETLAIERAKKLFGAQHANVQPHSGSQPNQAAYLAFLKAGDTILSMNLAAGGHLSHGHPKSFAGKFYRVVHYGVAPENNRIDYNEVLKIAKQERPKLIVAGSSSYSRTIDFRAFADIAKKVNAVLLADIAHLAGLVATRLHPSPVPYADVVTMSTHKTLRGPRGGIILTKKRHARAIDQAVFPGIQGGPFLHAIAAKAVALKEALSPSFKTYQTQTVKNARALSGALMHEGLRVVSGGTDNHMLTVDLTDLNISGRDAERLLERAGIYSNREPIPFDTRPPYETSGLRLGTPALTTRGMKEREMKQIGKIISELLKKRSPSAERDAKRLVHDLSNAFRVFYS